jgi:polyhydroxyalkanoate synthesis repressor PhaR
MVMQAEPFEVRDAKTSEDLTRSILLQIILEEETGGVPIFSEQMLAQLIRFYGHAMQGMMGAYLEKNLQTFVELQTRLAQPAKGLYDPSAYTPEAWTQWLQGQSPAMMQNLMGQYLEQSGSLFAQMQEQLQRSSAGLFAGMPGFAGKPSNEP